MSARWKLSESQPVGKHQELTRIARTKGTRQLVLGWPDWLGEALTSPVKNRLSGGIDHALTILTYPITLKPRGSLLHIKVQTRWMVKGYIIGPSKQACWLGNFASLTEHVDIGHPTDMSNYLIVLELKAILCWSRHQSDEWSEDMQSGRLFGLSIWAV